MAQNKEKTSFKLYGINVKSVKDENPSIKKINKQQTEKVKKTHHWSKLFAMIDDLLPTPKIKEATRRYLQQRLKRGLKQDSWKEMIDEICVCFTDFGEDLTLSKIESSIKKNYMKPVYLTSKTNNKLEGFKHENNKNTKISEEEF